MNLKELILQNDIQSFRKKMISDQNFLDSLIQNNLFWPNIELIYNKYGQKLFIELIKLLYDRDSNYIISNIRNIFKLDLYYTFYDLLFDFILEKNNNDYEFLFNLLTNSLMSASNISFSIILYLYKDNYFRNIIINNLYKILENSENCLLNIKKLLEDDYVLSKKVNDYINQNSNRLIYEIISNGFRINKTTVNKENIFDTIKIIVDEILNYENKKYSDIEFLDSGFYSCVYLIGNKVLKIGIKRPKFKIENNKRFLKPLLRCEINKINSSDILGCIEITEKVDTFNITNEDVYTIYKELRDLGYIWIDATKDNIGRLIRKNKVYFNDINPTKEATSYTTESTLELDKGELVILDNDFILKKKDAKKHLCYDNILEYEERYKHEKKKK
ncbi:MAG: hypothetical protein Q4E75_00475 [bacterium]|nr:hypothetical protein [bacterium]